MSTPPSARLIDVRHLGRERAIGCWDFGSALIDPGPESCIDTLLAGIQAEPRALLLTHIHLDHAGAAGALVARFPRLDVWVHSSGATHLIDPSRLLRSAERLYGDDMERLWGAVLPVPEANIRPLEGGETIEAADRTFAVAYSPGHASHHVVYFDPEDRTAYVGDVAGVRIPPADFILAPTPPPDIDVPRWHRSLELLRDMGPTRLALTHFGAIDDPYGHLARMSDQLDVQAMRAKELLNGTGGEEASAMRAFVKEISARIDQACDQATAGVYKQAAPPEQTWLGLVRYWRKQEAVEQTA
jgi:glyoxylase-like metal-dependent hydrolase (beta-lactamase superfamily II)